MFPTYETIDPEPELYGDFERQQDIAGREDDQDGSSVLV